MSWRVVEKDTTAAGIMDLLSMGLTSIVGANPAPNFYTVENEETGEIREVAADDEDDLGRQIAAGNFSDDD